MKDQSDDYWKNKLSEAQYKILRKKGTEALFTGKYLDNHEDGSYHCAACDNLLFDSNTKFESGSGWPSFTNPINKNNVELREDNSLGMQRTEVLCKNCGGHLGHVFSDGPMQHGGQRFCINSVSLNFEPKK